MDLTSLLAVALPMAAAIAVFFWSLDRIRKERTRADDIQPAPRATPRELVERLLRPAAENLSQRRSVRGRPTLTEDLARAGLNITPAEYLLLRIGAVALGALIGLFRFGISIGPIVLAAVGFVIPPLSSTTCSGAARTCSTNSWAGCCSCFPTPSRPVMPSTER